MPADASCALDVADRGGATLEEVGALINVTRERVRQIEVMALAHLAEQREEFAEFADSASDQQPARGKRSLPTVYLRRGSRADVIEAVRSGAKTIRDVAFLVYGSGDLPAYHRAARLLSSLVREGTLVRNRGYRIAGGVHG